MAVKAVDVVRAWHEALNAGDVERLIAHSSENIELGGPRGSARSIQVLREWVGRAGLHLEPRQTFIRDNAVVVEQAARWQLPGSTDAAEPETVASVFVVRDGRIASVSRYADLAAALAAASLTEADRI